MPNCAAICASGVASFCSHRKSGQRFQPLVARDRGLGTSLRFVWQVEIFEFGLFERSVDLRFEFGRELALFLDRRQHGFAALLQFAEVLQLLLNIANLDLVQIAGHLFAIARNEGYGGSSIEEFDDCVHSLQRDVKQLGNMNEYGGR